MFVAFSCFLFHLNMNKVPFCLMGVTQLLKCVFFRFTYKAHLIQLGLAKTVFYQLVKFSLSSWRKMIMKWEVVLSLRIFKMISSQKVLFTYSLFS